MLTTGPGPDGSPAPTAEPEVLPEHPVLARLQVGGTLKSKVQRGLAWSAGSRGLLVLASLGAQAVLARLLLPADYGLFAFVLVINALAAMLTELGLAAAIVHTRRLTDRLLATAFWLNALSGVVIAAVVFSLAPLIASFYGDPRIALMVQVSSLLFVLNVSSVPMALLQRSLRFRQVGMQEVVATVLGLVASIVLAAAGTGALSLVIGPIVQVVVMNVLVWAAVRWVPRGWMHRAELAELWRFGGGVTGASMLNFIARHADVLILGRVVSTSDLGLYSRSYTLMMVPLRQVSLVLSRVLLPAFAEMQAEPARLRRAWTTTLKASMLLGVPVGLGVAVAAPAVVETLFGARWLGMVLPLALLSASVPPQLIGRSLGPLYQALGRTGLQFRLTLVSTVLTVGAIFAGLPWGIVGVSAALLASRYVVLMVPLVPAMRLIGLPLRDLLVASRSALVASAAMVLAALVPRLLMTDVAAPLVLLAQVAAGGLVYAAAVWFLEPPVARAVLGRFRKRRR